MALEMYRSYAGDTGSRSALVYGRLRCHCLWRILPASGVGEGSDGHTGSDISPSPKRFTVVRYLTLRMDMWSIWESCPGTYKERGKGHAELKQIADFVRERRPPPGWLLPIWNGLDYEPRRARPALMPLNSLSPAPC